MCEIRSLEIIIVHTSKEPKCQEYEPRRLCHCSKYTGKRKNHSCTVAAIDSRRTREWKLEGAFVKFQVHYRNIFKLRKFRKCHMQKAFFFISHCWEVLY